MSVRVYVDMPNVIGDNIGELYAVAAMKDGTRVFSGGDITVWAKERQTAEWVKNDIVINSHIFCSNCLTRCKDDIPTKYCPSCGFLMKNWDEQIVSEGPKVNQKVKVTDNNGNVTYGTITKTFPPCESHSGRFVVEMHSKGRDHCEEFWYSDFGKSVEVTK